MDMYAIANTFLQGKSERSDMDPGRCSKAQVFGFGGMQQGLENGEKAG